MKKTITTLAMLSAVALLSAGIPDRYVETGFNLGVRGSNSYFGLGDIFTDTIVIDLNQMATDLGDNGLMLNLGANMSNFTNLNFGPKFKLGFFLNTDASAAGGIPKSFFELASEGNDLNKTYTGDLNISGDVFVEAGAYFGTQIAFLDVKFQPALFMPLIHIDKPTASYSFRTNSDGTLYADVKTDVPIYSVIPLEGSDEGVSTGEVLSKLVASSGLDFSGSASMKLFPTLLTVGGRIQHLPLIPARLKERTRFQAEYTVNMEDLMDNLGSDNMFETTEESEFTSDQKQIYVLRPFKLGGNAVYTPFRNNFVSIEPNLDLAVYTSVYVDVGVKAKFDLFNIFAVTLSTNYEDMIWKEQLGLMLNLRIIEIDFLIGSQSDNFVKSFSGAGLGASLGMKVGF